MPVDIQETLRRVQLRKQKSQSGNLPSLRNGLRREYLHPRQAKARAHFAFRRIPLDWNSCTLCLRVPNRFSVVSYVLPISYYKKCATVSWCVGHSVSDLRPRFIPGGGSLFFLGLSDHLEELYGTTLSRCFQLFVSNCCGSWLLLSSQPGRRACFLVRRLDSYERRHSAAGSRHASGRDFELLF